MPAETRLFLCLKDNYGVLLHDSESGATASIDAPEAAPIEAALKATGWKLTDILVTHHHADHTGGIVALKEKYKCRVVAPAAEADTIPAVDQTVREGDKVTVGKLTGSVIETPGHTNGHIAYWFHADKLAFVGDTLFSIGCGRVIEGTPGMMWRSLVKLRDLPNDTEIYCGHEYTAANIRFARTIEPDNPVLAAREAQVKQQIAARRADHSGHHRRRETGQSVPARRSAGGRRRHRHGRQGGSAGVRGDQGAEEQVLTVRMPTAADIIRALDLKPHPEGGHYRETFRDPRVIDGRAASTSIYFLLKRGERSHWHRIDAVEIWHYYAGAPLKLEVVDGAKEEIVRLGADIHAGEVPQFTVPARAWQAAESFGDWTLVGCTVAPGFSFDGFELAPKDWKPNDKTR